ncbi:uncharacterized protein TNCV_3418431 [Trichonephila clavipes]|nr:uncharacterized protein TNCV_3418431 [Trichonephila clavipes]
MRPSWSHKLKRDSSEKRTWCQSACQALCSSALCRPSRRLFVVREILYKGTLARNLRCRRRQRIDEAEINTPIAVDQRAADCLEEAVWLITAMWSRHRSSRADVTFFRPLPFFRVVRCSSVHCFQTRITVKLFRCPRASIAR